jgi:uncharacterized membrane protein
MASPPGQPPDGPLNTLLDEINALRAQVAALTARVYHLEQRTGVEAGMRPQAIPPVQYQPPAPPAGTTPQPASAHGTTGMPARQQLPNLPAGVPTRPPTVDTDLEKKIGQYWLNRIGIIAMLVGVSYFLKFAFENNWIGPGGRIVIGLLAGIGLVLWSERFRAKGYTTFSYSLKAVGIGTIYLSLWGGFQVYHLIPAAAAFLAMVIVTACTLALSLSQNTELLASFALIGGFATPVLLSTGQNHEVVLFSYVFLLDAAILVMAIFKPWRRLLWGSFAGTLILYFGWYNEYYSQDQRALTVFFAASFAALFAAIPLATRYEQSTRFPGPSITLTLLPLFNAATFFLALYAMYARETTTLTWFALALAAVYLGISGAFKKRFPGQDTKFINLLHVAIAIAFITIAIPLKLEGQWITIGWLVESAALLWISVKTQTDFLRYLAVTALTLGIIRLLFFDQFQTETLLFNARFATYVVAIAILAGIALFGARQASADEMVFIRVAVVSLNLLALIALTLEASDYFNRQFSPGVRVIPDYRQLFLARDFSYSAIWLIYGVALMAVGFQKRSAFVRWQSLILIAFTIIKVFFHDISELGGSYRILSFVGLGAILLGISFVYQRDWLKLSPRSADKSGQGT